MNIIKNKTLIKVKHIKRNINICEKTFYARGVIERMRGLMGRKNWGSWDGIVLDPCNSIHTYFMKMRIDVIFLDKDNKVVKVYNSMEPWRFLLPILRAKRTLEVTDGFIKRNDIQVGDQLEFYV